MSKYNLSDFDYHLPPELIAQEPLNERDSSRMMVLNRKTESIETRIFSQLPAFLQKGDMLVLNNTKVIPARLIGRLMGRDKPAELLLLRKISEQTWECMVKPGRYLKPGDGIQFDHGIEARISGLAEKGLRLVEFKSGQPLEILLPQLGKVPLPPYIKKEVDSSDQYQTIYARENGSAAAPTAGFHFTERVFEALKEKGVDLAYITLHIGPGTFQPVKADDIRDHVMHREYFKINDVTAEQINRCRSAGGRIVAVGTTVCRVLESVVDEQGVMHSADRSTDLYIYPGYRFRAVDAMLTNFHLPRSSLIMMICALAGYEFTMQAYRQAVKEKYRFFSFGDCMFII